MEKDEERVKERQSESKMRWGEERDWVKEVEREEERARKRDETVLVLRVGERHE